MDSDSFSMVSFILIFILLFLNGFFVAAEFAVVKVRSTKIDQLINEGNKRAKYVKRVLGDLDTHLATAQLGITLTSLGIGAVAEPAFESLLDMLFHGYIPENILSPLAFITGFALATVLHITIGEQVPKMWAIEKSENMSLWTAPFLYWFCKISYPLIKVLDILTRVVLKIIGVKKIKENDEHSTEEIKLIVSNSTELEPDEQKMFNRIFDFHERMVREVIVHRKDMEVIFLTDDLDFNLNIIYNSRHSRFPVCQEDKDDIIGYINVKDLYKLSIENQPIKLEEIIRKIPRIYETTPIKRALNLLQREKHQMAVVIDEYGGVSGLFTIEDIIEEIVGEIQDEFDDDVDSIQRMKDKILIDGSTHVDFVSKEIGIDLEEIDGVDTIGGYIMSKMDDVPKQGATIEIEGYHVRLIDVHNHRINLLEFRTPPLETSEI